MFSVYLFAADPGKLRQKLATDAAMVPEIAERMRCRHGMARGEIKELCARVTSARSLVWPAPGDMLSVHAFLWMLDYAAERINLTRLDGVRYSSLAYEAPLLGEMVAKSGPLPVPAVSGLECDIGFLAPGQLRELAERGPPPCANPHLDVGTELIEIFESLAHDGLGLYTIIDGAKMKGHP